MAIENLISMESHGPPITEADVFRFEEKLGCRLPDDYREFLLAFNGGQTSLKQVVFSIGTDETILNSFYGLGDPTGDIEEGQYDQTDGFGFPPELLVIGYDDGGSSVCLVIHGDRRGEVWFYDTLDPHEPKRMLAWYDRKRDFKKLASSFTAFIQMLRPYDED
jgi:hypothetical protein